MANLKQNMIKLVKGVKDGEVITEKYWTPAFIPLSVVYQAIDLSIEIANVSLDDEKEMIDKMVEFVANEIYKGKFSKEELINGLHAPDAIQILREQVFFILRGQQSDETKKYLEKKN